MSIDKSEITIGIVTALPEEYQAVKAILENVKPFKEPDDPSYYTMGQIKVLDDFGGGIHHIALNIPSKMGNNTASAIASHLTRTFEKVEHLLMVGIAGGMPQCVKLGDIVVAEKIIQYDFGKREEGDKFILKGEPSQASEPLLNAHYCLESQKPQFPWHAHLDTIVDALDGQNLGLDFGFKRPENSQKRPHVFCGTIGSANMVLKNAQIRDKLFHEYGICAVEMEGCGVADAAKKKGANFIIIRGICDYCDQSKGDKWHGYAAAVAASYTKALIECLKQKEYNSMKEKHNKLEIPRCGDGFFAYIMLHIMFPFLPLGLEYANKYSITETSLVLMTCIYSIFVGLSSRSESQFFMSISMGVIFTYLYTKVAIDLPSGAILTSIIVFSLLTLLVVITWDILERYERHVVECEKFLVWSSQKKRGKK